MDVGKNCLNEPEIILASEVQCLWENASRVWVFTKLVK